MISDARINQAETNRNVNLAESEGTAMDAGHSWSIGHTWAIGGARKGCC